MSDTTAKKRLNPVLSAAMVTAVFSFAILAGTQLRICFFGGANDLLLFCVTFSTVFLFAVFPGWKGNGSFGDRIFEWVYPPPTNDWFAFLVFSLVNALVVAFLFVAARQTWRLFLVAKTHYLAE